MAIMAGKLATLISEVSLLAGDFGFSFSIWVRPKVHNEPSNLCPSHSPSNQSRLL